MFNYISQATRTDIKDYNGSRSRLNTLEMSRIMHGAMGISTEANEILDMLKKHIAYGKPFDKVNLAEEVGDVFWYCAIILDELGMTFDQVQRMNINKLKTRFPDKFTEDNAIKRDLDSERKQLEFDFEAE